MFDILIILYNIYIINIGKLALDIRQTLFFKKENSWQCFTFIYFDNIKKIKKNSKIKK